MRVNIYDVAPDGTETLRAAGASLSECYPDDPEARYKAENELRASGRYWDGGGATPLVLLTVYRGA